jgi:hypothetical protein
MWLLGELWVMRERSEEGAVVQAKETQMSWEEEE